MLAAGNGVGELLAQDFDVQALLLVEGDDDEARHRQFGKIEAGAEPGLQEFLGLRLGIGAHRGDARRLARELGGLRGVGIEVAAGRRADLDRHLAGDLVLPAARGVADQDRGAGGERGQKRHDGDDGHERAPGDRGRRHERDLAVDAAPESRRSCRSCPNARRSPPLLAPAGSRRRKNSSRASIVNMKAAVAKDEPAGAVELVHQGEIMGRDHHRRSRFVELGEKPQQPSRQARIDIAGRLVGEQKLRPHDEGAGNRGALLLAAGEHGRQNMHALAETDPVQKLHHLGAVARFLLAAHAQRKRDVFIGRQMVEQPEILKDDADPPPEAGDRGFVEGERVAAKQAIEPRVGRKDKRMSRKSVVLPAPEGPVRN